MLQMAQSAQKLNDGLRVPGSIFTWNKYLYCLQVVVLLFINVSLSVCKRTHNTVEISSAMYLNQNHLFQVIWLQAFLNCQKN